MNFLVHQIKSLLPPPLKSRLRQNYEILMSLIVSSSNMFRIISARIIWLAHRHKLPDTADGVLVNLGCGMTNHPKFINVDGYPHPHVHFVHRIDQLPMFAEKSVDLIYASHCLEHFKYRMIDNVLKEWVRVLKPGGLIRLSVPDFDKLLAIYSDTGNPDDIVEQIMGGQDNRYNFHYVLFNKKNLTNHLIRAGCTDIHEWVPGSNDLTTFSDFSVYQKDIGSNKYKISLNLEARKV